MSASPSTAPPQAGLEDGVASAAAPPVLAAEPSPARAATTDAALFTGGTYVALGLQFIAGLVQKAIIGPVANGYWALMQTFWTFMTMAPLGAQHGATRQVPLLRGRGEYAAAGVAAGTGATFGAIAMTVVGLLAATVAIVFGGGWADEMRFGVVLLGVTAPLRYLADTHEIIIQSIKRFDIASITVVVKAVGTLVLQTLAVLAFGFYGIFLGVVAVEASGFVLWLRMGVISRARPAFHVGIDREQLRGLIAFGAPLLITAQVWLLFQSVDSLIVAGGLDVRQLGFYALAVSVTNYILYLPKTVGSVLSPRMAEQFGATGELSAIQHYATDTQRLLAYMLVPVAVASGYFAFPVLIRHGLPDFEPAIDVVRIMIAASFFMALMSMPIKALLTAGYRWFLTAILGVCLVINATLNLVAVMALDKGIEGAAFATALSYLITFLATTGYGLSRTMRPREVAGHLLEILAVFVHVYLALRLIDWLLGTDDDLALIADVALAAAKLLLFLALLSPWLVAIERRLRGLSMLRDLALQAVRR